MLLRRTQFQRFLHTRKCLQPRQQRAHLTTARGVGYCGLDVYTPKDWLKATKRAISVCDKIVEDIKSEHQPAKIIQLMDKLSDTICTVSDPAELCANTHPNPHFAQAASDSVALIGSYVNKLNTSSMLYEKTLHALEKREELTEEQFMVGNQLRIEFEHHGVHLETSKRNELYQLQDEIMELSRELQIMQSAGSKKTLEVSKSILQELPGVVSKSIKTQGDKVLLSTSPLVVDNVMAYASSSEVRRQLYLLSNNLPEELSLLEQVLQKRQKLAELLGFPSFCHMASWHRMLKSPQDILNFLDLLYDKTKPKIEQELQVLKEEKRKVDPQSADVIYPWDVEFLKDRVSARVHKPHLGYFTVQNVLEGLTLICKHLFDINFTRVEHDPDEVWDPNVKKMALIENQSGKLLGYVYLDLFSRPNKVGGAANFPIRFPSMHNDIGRIALVCNFDPPSGSRFGMLTWHEVETLFHEFGHTLQALLSQTQLQHFAGTRSFLDFVETFSLFFEHFPTDYRVARLWAKHYRDGTPIPEEAIENHKQYKQKFSGIEMQHQILISVLDQHVHSPAIMERDSLSMLESLSAKYSVFPHVPGAAWHAKLTHLIGYGACYYSYLLSGVNSSSIWRQLFLDNPLSREAGERVRTQLLAYGGAKEPAQLMQSLLDGQPPSVDEWLHDRLGI